MANVLTDPPFAADPPVKLNVSAKVLGLILGILATIGAVVSLLELLAAFGACTVLGQTLSGCGLPILWLLGAILQLAGFILGAVGGFRMYQMNRLGKENVIWGLALGALGTIVYLIGNIIFYSGYGSLGGYGGAIVGTIIDLIIIFVLYYLVIISRFPGEAPLVASPYPPYGGGYGSPPPPPPPA